MNRNVKIRLMQDGTKVLRITDLTENGESFMWIVPDTLPDGTYSIILGL